jgi:hypothetical protein
MTAANFTPPATQVAVPHRSTLGKMRSTSVLLVIVAVALTGCFSYSRNASNSERYRGWTGQSGYISRRLWLYEANAHQYTYRKMVLSDHRFINPTRLPTDPLWLVMEIAPGTPVHIDGFKREHGGDGHGWEYMLGTVTLADGEPVEFEYNLGLFDDPQPVPVAVSGVRGNQTLEPAPAVVSGPADAGLAPAHGVVHPERSAE